MALGIDGTVQAVNGNTANLALPGFTTSLTNDIVVVAALSNNAFSGVPTSANLTFTLRKNNGAGSPIAIWTAPSSGTLSSEVITLPNPAAFTTGAVAAVSGANFASPYDGNANIPQSNTTGLLTATTDNANDILVAAYRFASTSNPTQGAGYTLLYGANFFLFEYKIVSATQAASSVPIGTGDTDENGGVLDALVQAAAAGGPFPMFTPGLTGGMRELGGGMQG